MILSNNEIRRLQKKHKFAFHKRLGQNFLTDENVLGKIMDSFSLRGNDRVIEIGPGLGQMTEALSAGAREVIAVEIDRTFVRILRGRMAGHANVNIVHADFLKFKPEEPGRGERYKVISNLPYAISSPAIARLIGYRRMIAKAHLMLQKELASRATASADTADYGSLSVFVQTFCDADLLFTVSRRCFYPPPKVDSAMVSFVVRKAPKFPIKEERPFFSIVRAAFSKRRKTVLNALCGGRGAGFDRPAVLRAMEACRLDPRRRGETFSPVEFARLANELRVRPSK